MSETIAFDLLRDIAHLMDSRRQEGGPWDDWEISIRDRIAAFLIANAPAAMPRSHRPWCATQGRVCNCDAPHTASTQERQ